MIIYRSQERLVATGSALARVRESLAAVASRSDHESAQQLVIDLGEFEAGVADGGAGIPVCKALRRTSVAAGHILYRSWKGLHGREWVGRVEAELATVAGLDLPLTLRISVPEGYAYYGLYPETYIAATERFANVKHRGHAVVIGIRSIGTGLSGVVAATLEEVGWTVNSHTVRPGGHPFDRVLDLPGALPDDLRDPAGAEVLIVDEGPGMSGSSFAAVARAVASAGIGAERISLFPSWNPDGSGFRNFTAAAIWRSHARFTIPFDDVSPLPADAVDVSGGAWRPILLGRDERLWPPVQPQHEARKFVSGGSLLKFAGLGRYGREKLELATILGRERFTPPAITLRNGFLETHLVSGVPFRPAVAAPRALLESAARYLAFRSRTLPRACSVSFDEIVRMISFNSEQGAGVAPPDGWFREMRAEIEDRGATAVDGRMLAHEWLDTPGGFVKADAVDHHADHFFPGDTDIAWDLAASAIEFRLSQPEKHFLLQQYRTLAGDVVSSRVLMFYETAWLAFRLGYTTLAEEATDGAERNRFARERRRYAAALQITVRACAEIGQVPA